MSILFSHGKNNLFISIMRSLNNFIAPPRCEICEKLLELENNKFEFLCQKCFDSIPLAPQPDKVYNRLISNFDKDDLYINGAISLFSIKENHDYMNAIYSLKYKGFSRIGSELGKELGRFMKLYHKTNYDAIVPVPIHHARKRERGYNQSEFIAKGISDVIDCPVKMDIIKRKKYTKTQTLLSKIERRTNVEKAIAPFKKNTKLSGGSYLLVDDVLTTGSTLNSCAKILLSIGAKNVEVATLVFA